MLIIIEFVYLILHIWYQQLQLKLISVVCFCFVSWLVVLLLLLGLKVKLENKDILTLQKMLVISLAIWLLSHSVYWLVQFLLQSVLLDVVELLLKIPSQSFRYYFLSSVSWKKMWFFKMISLLLFFSIDLINAIRIFLWTDIPFTFFLF